jgi:F0F1-type ATP synthase assembly protein I
LARRAAANLFGVGAIFWTAGKAARFTAIGFEFSGPIIAGAIAGHYLDLYLHTDPWMTFTLFITGVILGFYRLIRELQLVQRTMRE